MARAASWRCSPWSARSAPRENRRRAAMVVVGLIGATLLYGDGAITPAISVLSAIEGIKIYAPQPGSCRGAADGGNPRHVVCHPAQRHILHRRTFRAGHADLVHRRRRSWALSGSRGRPQYSRHSVRCRPSPICWHAGPMAFAVIGGAFLAVTGGEAFYADMGHFGPLADPSGLVRRGAAGADAQLFRSGRRCCCTNPGAREPVLRSWRPHGRIIALVAARDRGHGHRVAGDHFGRLFHDPAGHSARLPAAHECRAHGRRRDRPDLCARSSIGRWRSQRSRRSSASAPRTRWPALTASPCRC